MPFTPARFLSNPHLQTILPRFIKGKPSFTPTYEVLTTPDGDNLDIVWSDNPQDKQVQNKPIFILFHGLEGSFGSPYAHGLMDAFKKAGWLSVMMHYRSCGPSVHKALSSYHSGKTDDVRHFLKWLHRRFPNNNKVAVGISLSGNMLVNYLNQFNDDPILDAACSVCAPMDLSACSTRIDSGFSKIYRRHLVGSLKQKALLKERELNKQFGVNKQDINNVITLTEFDDLVTAPIHGFNGALDYYQRCSGIFQLDRITTPLHIIHAADDPFMTDAVIPKSNLPTSIDYKIVSNGGHVGFIEGSLFKPRFWLERYLPNYYKSLN